MMAEVRGYASCFTSLLVSCQGLGPAVEVANTLVVMKTALNRSLKDGTCMI